MNRGVCHSAGPFAMGAGYDHGVAQTQQQDQATPSAKATASATEFVRAHGGSARAVVENLGRAGARVVLIGDDGAFGDVLVRNVAVGRALVDAVEGLAEYEWNSETMSALRIGPEYRRRMAGVRR